MQSFLFFCSLETELTHRMNQPFLLASCYSPPRVRLGRTITALRSETPACHAPEQSPRQTNTPGCASRTAFYTFERKIERMLGEKRLSLFLMAKMMPQETLPNRPQHQESLLLLATCFIVLIKNHIMIKRDEETSKSGPCSPKNEGSAFFGPRCKERTGERAEDEIAKVIRHLVEVYDLLSSLSSPIKARSFILPGVCF